MGIWAMAYGTGDFFARSTGYPVPVVPGYVGRIGNSEGATWQEQIYGCYAFGITLEKVGDGLGPRYQVVSGNLFGSRSLSVSLDSNRLSRGLHTMQASHTHTHTHAAAQAALGVRGGFLSP